MKKYKVEITETLQRVIEVVAETPEDAVKYVSEAYHEGLIVLDENDFVGVEITNFN